MKRFTGSFEVSATICYEQETQNTAIMAGIVLNFMHHYHTKPIYTNYCLLNIFNNSGSTSEVIMTSSKLGK